MARAKPIPKVDGPATRTRSNSRAQSAEPAPTSQQATLRRSNRNQKRASSQGAIPESSLAPITTKSRGGTGKVTKPAPKKKKAGKQPTKKSKPSSQEPNVSAPPSEKDGDQEMSDPDHHDNDGDQEMSQPDDAAQDVKTGEMEVSDADDRDSGYAPSGDVASDAEMSDDHAATHAEVPEFDEQATGQSSGAYQQGFASKLSTIDEESESECNHRANSPLFKSAGVQTESPRYASVGQQTARRFYTFGSPVVKPDYVSTGVQTTSVRTDDSSALEALRKNSAPFVSPLPKNKTVFSHFTNIFPQVPKFISRPLKLLLAHRTTESETASEDQVKLSEDEVRELYARLTPAESTALHMQRDEENLQLKKELREALMAKVYLENAQTFAAKRRPLAQNVSTPVKQPESGAGENITDENPAGAGKSISSSNFTLNKPNISIPRPEPESPSDPHLDPAPRRNSQAQTLNQDAPEQNQNPKAQDPQRKRPTSFRRRQQERAEARKRDAENDPVLRLRLQREAEYKATQPHFMWSLKPHARKRVRIDDMKVIPSGTYGSYGIPDEFLHVDDDTVLIDSEMADDPFICGPPTKRVKSTRMMRLEAKYGRSLKTNKFGQIIGFYFIEPTPIDEETIGPSLSRESRDMNFIKGGSHYWVGELGLQEMLERRGAEEEFLSHYRFCRSRFPDRFSEESEFTHMDAATLRERKQENRANIQGLLEELRQKKENEDKAATEAELRKQRQEGVASMHMKARSRLDDLEIQGKITSGSELAEIARANREGTWNAPKTPKNSRGQFHVPEDSGSSSDSALVSPLPDTTTKKASTPPPPPPPTTTTTTIAPQEASWQSSGPNMVIPGLLEAQRRSRLEETKRILDEQGRQQAERRRLELEREREEAEGAGGPNIFKSMGARTPPPAIPAPQPIPPPKAYPELLQGLLDNFAASAPIPVPSPATRARVEAEWEKSGSPDELFYNDGSADFARLVFHKLGKGVEKNPYA